MVITRGTVHAVCSYFWRDLLLTEIQALLASTMARMHRQVAAIDGTVKFMFPAGDGLAFEAAYFCIPGRDRPHIACVSTQLGCAIRCGFCATQKDGLFRQLTSREISEQIDAVVELAMRNGACESELEVSFMGMGDPLANRREVIRTIQYVHARYPKMSRVSVSTVGPSRLIAVFGREIDYASLPVHLQISLHATNDHIRAKLVPGVRDTLEHLLEAGRDYSLHTGDTVCLNYILLHGLNDSDEDATWLSRIDPRFFYVKLTHLNPIPGLANFISPACEGRFQHFVRVLESNGVPVKVFRGDGLDVRASCGQLASRPVQVELPSWYAVNG